MTPTQFKEALKGLHLTQWVFADLLGVARLTVSRWANGWRGQTVPKYASLVLDLLEDKKRLMDEVARLKPPGFVSAQTMVAAMKRADEARRSRE